MAHASDAQREEMAEKNRAYEARFGFTYIICASGKTVDELLAALTQRLENDAAAELARAGQELLAIANLRLRKLCEP